MIELTQSDLREELDYSPEIGVFYRRHSRGGQCKGAVAGSAKTNGYTYVSVKRTKPISWPSAQCTPLE